jgi:alkylhydroperoxidase family enzyme
VGSHAAVAARLIGSDYVAKVLGDFRSSDLPANEKALFALVEKAGTASWKVTREDVEAARSAGWSDEAIHDALTVVSIFKYYNTWIDASGVRDLPSKAYGSLAKRLTTIGYVPRGH